ncbi:MAG TPA: hypothetical protein ENK05_03935 [Gammaproteobacteria bacterium]|nr:hypothetical protein [Gammaproteobacteria bacterium]
MPRLIVLLMLVVLAACQPVTVQHNEGSLPVVVRVDDAAYWLEEWNKTEGLPDEQLKLALKTREHEFAGSPSPRTRLRLALLLAQGPAAVRDQKRALELLQGLDRDAASASAVALAALLTQVIREQQWSADRIAELRAKVKVSETRAAELEQQLQEAEEQLKQLTTIEQKIQQRE